MKFSHVSVMPLEALRYLDCERGGVYVDGTVGGAGHSVRILEASMPSGRLVAMDVDEDAIEEAKRVLRPYGEKAIVVRENYGNIKTVLEGLGIKEVSGILLDLGVSSHQFEVDGRGFSFMRDARLDMRMDTRQTFSAFELINEYAAEDLKRIFREYGEERFAGPIARAIVRERAVKPIETTDELSRLVSGFYTRRPRRIHPATRVFQAVRMEVNDELAHLRRALEGGMEVLRSNGRFVVISFHSLEDRMVKLAFKRYSSGCECPSDFPQCVCGKEPLARILTKKAVRPSPEETSSNPRSRSAKLRALEKI